MKPTKRPGQELSCREGGQFDRKFIRNTHTDVTGAVTYIERTPTTGWGRICRDRAKAGLNRRSRKASAHSSEVTE